jgi:GT2 family glycosyltransferase
MPVMSTTSANKRPSRLAVIIPSRDGYRGGAVPRLLESIAAQTYTDYAVHLVTGVFPQGKAINQGVAATTGELLLILDDDSWLADETVFARLVDTIDGDARIGMAGASIVAPPGAARFQRKAGRQFPRFNTPVVDEVTDSDLACHGCCVIPRRVLEAIGGEREDLIRGLDPDLRVRIREAGYRVVLAPGARIHHPLPAGLRPLLHVFFRNGYGSAYAQKYRPESVYDTHERLADAHFQPRRPLAYRAARFPLRLGQAVARGQGLRFAAYCAYAIGYVWGLVTAKEDAIEKGY